MHRRRQSGKPLPYDFRHHRGTRKNSRMSCPICKSDRLLAFSLCLSLAPSVSLLSTHTITTTPITHPYSVLLHSLPSLSCRPDTGTDRPPFSAPSTPTTAFSYSKPAAATRTAHSISIAQRYVCLCVSITSQPPPWFLVTPELMKSR